MAVRVVNIKNGRCDHVMDRTTKYGNPFHIGRDGTREEVIEKYRVKFAEWLLNGTITFEELISFDGSVLGCWCKPEPCHCDVIATAIATAIRLGKDKFMDSIRKHYGDKIDQGKPFLVRKLRFLMQERSEVLKIIHGAKNHLKDTDNYWRDIQEMGIYAEVELKELDEEIQTTQAHLEIKNQIREIRRKPELTDADRIKILALVKQRVELEKMSPQDIPGELLYEEGDKYDIAERIGPDKAYDGEEGCIWDRYYESGDDRLINEPYPAPELGNLMLQGIESPKGFLTTFRRTFRRKNQQGEGIEDIYDEYPVHMDQLKNWEEMVTS